MFDYLRSSYDLGEKFTNVECQTKSIEEYHDGTMTYYWIDPSGYLWYGDYIGTSVYSEIKKDDPRYNHKVPFLNYEWIPTGHHGKYRVHPITKYVTIYPSSWHILHKERPECRLHFKMGKLQDFEYLNYD